MPDMVAYPHLINPSLRGGWSATVCDPEHSAVEMDTKTGKRSIQVPTARLREEHQIQTHELYHVKDGPDDMSYYVGKPKALYQLYKMLTEVGVDSWAEADGNPVMGARDILSWQYVVAPTNEIEATMWVLQLYMDMNHGPHRSEPLVEFYNKALAMLSDEIRDLVLEAAASVHEDWSKGNRRDWATILCTHLVKTKEEPLKPEDFTHCKPTVPCPPEGGPEGEEGEPRRTRGGKSEDDEEDDEDYDGEGEGSEADCPDCEGTGSSGGSETGDPVDADCKRCDGSGAVGKDTLTDEEKKALAEAAKDVPTTASAPPGGEVYKGTDPGVTFLEDPLFKPPVLPRMGRDAEEVRKELEEAIKEELEAKERAERKGGEASVSAHLDYKTPFGKIDLHRHTMTGHSTKLISLSWRASEVGGNLRAPHRLYPSARIFSARAPGGTIVVDWSGSMGWHDRDLENAIADIPRLRAVIYSMHREAYGAFRGRSTSTLDAAEARAAYMNKVGKYVARVCILADNGRLSPLPNRGQEPEHTSGNGDADKAALYWATRTSPQPIVWVSDGGVEAETYGNWRACDMLMKRYRIVRVLTIQDAIKYLRGEYITGWTATAATPHRKLRRNSAFIQESKDPSRGYW